MQSHAEVLGVVISTQEFGGDTIQLITKPGQAVGLEGAVEQPQGSTMYKTQVKHGKGLTISRLQARRCCCYSETQHVREEHGFGKYVKL